MSFNTPLPTATVTSTTIYCPYCPLEMYQTAQHLATLNWLLVALNITLSLFLVWFVFKVVSRNAKKTATFNKRLDWIRNSCTRQMVNEYGQTVFAVSKKDIDFAFADKLDD